MDTVNTPDMDTGVDNQLTLAQKFALVMADAAMGIPVTKACRNRQMARPTYYVYLSAFRKKKSPAADTARAT